MVSLGLTESLSFTTTILLSLHCVSDHRRRKEGRWIRSQKIWLERGKVVLGNKTWVSIFLEFMGGASDNHMTISHVTLSF